jgi:hypothetical protein
MMEIQEAKEYVNRRVELSWLDRRGETITDEVDVYEVTFVPLYGPCMITSAGEIRLDRVQACVETVPLRIAS